MVQYWDGSAAIVHARLAVADEHCSRLVKLRETLRHRPEGGVPEGGEPIGGQGLVLLSRLHQRASVGSIAATRDGLIAVASWDGSVELYDPLSLHGRCRIGAFSTLKDAASSAQVPTPADAVTAANSILYGGSSAANLALAIGSDLQLWATHPWSSRQPGADFAWRTGSASHGAPITDLASHPARPVLCSAGEDGKAVLWDIYVLSRLRSFSRNNAELLGCSFLSKWSASERTRSGERDFAPMFNASAVATAGSDGAACIWDVRAADPVRTMLSTASVTCLDCESDSSLLAFGYSDGGIACWDTRMWREINLFDVRPYAGASSYPRSIAISPCGTHLAVGGHYGELVVFNRHRLKQIWKAFPLHQDSITSIAWWGRPASYGAPADGKSGVMSTENFLACGSIDGSWSCWSLAAKDFREVNFQVNKAKE